MIDEPWSSSGRERAEHPDLLDDCVGSWIAERTRDEILEAYEEADAAIAPVYDVAHLMADEHVEATDLLSTVEDEELGPVRMHNAVFRMSPGWIRRTEESLGFVDALRESDTTAVVEGGSVDPADVGGARATIELFERLAARR